MGHSRDWGVAHGFGRHEVEEAQRSGQISTEDPHSPFSDYFLYSANARGCKHFESRIDAMDHAGRWRVSGSTFGGEIGGASYTAAKEDENQVNVGWGAEPSRCIQVDVPAKEGMSALDVYKAAVTKAKRSKKIQAGEVAQPHFTMRSGSFYDTITVKRTRTRKVVAGEGKKVTKYFVVRVGTGNMPRWSEGFDTLTEAKKHFPDFTKTETVAENEYGWETQDEYEIVSMSRKDSGEGLSRTETEIKEERLAKPMHRVILRVGQPLKEGTDYTPKVKRGEPGWVFWGDTHY